MARRFKEARMMRKINVNEAAEKLGVLPTSLHAWERGAKNPTLENLEAMADLYGVSTDYLLGRANCDNLSVHQSIPFATLKIMHGKSVWSPKYGWALVDTINNKFITVNEEVPLTADIGELYLIPNGLFERITPTNLIDRNNLSSYTEIIVEPITNDTTIRQQLCGYYKVKDGFVENATGSRFFFDTYGFNWLAFEK